MAEPLLWVLDTDTFWSWTSYSSWTTFVWLNHFVGAGHWHIYCEGWTFIVLDTFICSWTTWTRSISWVLDTDTWWLYRMAEPFCGCWTLTHLLWGLDPWHAWHTVWKLDFHSAGHLLYEAVHRLKRRLDRSINWPLTSPWHAKASTHRRSLTSTNTWPNAQHMNIIHTEFDKRLGCPLASPGTHCRSLQTGANHHTG